MDFTLCPDAGPPRVVRFTTEFQDHVLCRLDAHANVLTMNRQMYELLDSVDQNRALTTRAKALFLTERGKITPFDPLLPPQEHTTDAAA